jgi:hypothetical protein
MILYHHLIVLAQEGYNNILQVLTGISHLKNVQVLSFPTQTVFPLFPYIFSI